MKTFALTLLFTLCALPAFAAEFKTLATHTTSWDGQAIKYPEGTPEVTAIKLTFAPGEKLPYHCHPFSTVGFVSEGELEVEKLNGEKQKFKKGDTLVEVANTWHRGVATAEGGTELVGFYIGLKDVKNTIMMTDENKDVCK